MNKASFIVHLCCLLGLVHAASAAVITVREITTDFGGSWTTGDGTTGMAGISPTEPNNHHMLQEFKAGPVGATTTYDTQNRNWRALPIVNMFSNEVMYGSNIDGDTGANLAPAYPWNGTTEVTKYVTDGIWGLDMGTATNNSSGQTFDFDLVDVLPSAIGDGIADIVLFDVAVTVGGETFQFYTRQGVPVGNLLTISTAEWNRVGFWRTDRWRVGPPGSPNENTPVLGDINGRKEIRGVAFELDQLISASDIPALQAAGGGFLQMFLPGADDIAVAAFNTKSLNIISRIPEPESVALYFAGVFALCGLRNRKRADRPQRHDVLQPVDAGVDGNNIYR